MIIIISFIVNNIIFTRCNDANLLDTLFLFFEFVDSLVYLIIIIAELIIIIIWLLFHLLTVGFLFLNTHSYEIFLHCFLKSLLIFFRIYDSRSFSSINDIFKLTLENLIKSILLNIIDNSKSNLLPLSINDC